MSRGQVGGSGGVGGFKVAGARFLSRWTPDPCWGKDSRVWMFFFNSGPDLQVTCQPALFTHRLLCFRERSQLAPNLTCAQGFRGPPPIRSESDILSLIDELSLKLTRLLPLQSRHHKHNTHITLSQSSLRPQHSVPTGIARVSADVFFLCNHFRSLA